MNALWPGARRLTFTIAHLKNISGCLTLPYIMRKLHQTRVSVSLIHEEIFSNAFKF